MLRRRAAAVLSGDAEAFAATVADRSAASGRRQVDSFGAARALRVSRLEVGAPVVEPVTTGGTASASATRRTASASATAGTASASATAGTAPARHPRVATACCGPGPRSTCATGSTTSTAATGSPGSVRPGARGSGVGRQVEAERPAGPGATAPWLAMPGLRVQRGQHVVVAGTVPTPRLAEHVATVDGALPALARQWPGTPDRVLVLAPATAGEADALLGRPSGSAAAPVAATTEGPTGPGGTSTGDRVVLDPAAFDRLTESGREVVLTHELAHVAVRSTVPGRAAGWLAEGYADHVGYASADVPTRRLVAPLVAALRTGDGPTELPSAADLHPAGGDLEVPYLAAWQAVELLAREHGEAALRRLVAAGASTGSDADAEAATDRALVSVLGTTRAELHRRLAHPPGPARRRRLKGPRKVECRQHAERWWMRPCVLPALDEP